MLHTAEGYPPQLALLPSLQSSHHRFPVFWAAEGMRCQRFYVKHCKKKKKNAACQLREKRKIVLHTDVVEVGDMNL